MATPTTLPATFVAGNVLTAAQLNDLRGAFRVLQVVSTDKKDTFSTTSTSYVDVTGLNVSITPSSTSSKILVAVNVGTFGNTNFGVTSLLQVLRDSTVISAPTGGTSPATIQSNPTGATGVTMTTAVSTMLLDSPSSTSALTYKAQMRVNGGTGWLNRLHNDAQFTAVSSIIVMEISA